MWSARKVVGCGVLCLLAACPPEGETFETNCSNELLSVGNPWHCEGSLKLLKKSQSLSFSTPSRNFRVQARGFVAVSAGSVRVDLKGANGVERSQTSSVGKPVTFDLGLPLNRPGGKSKAFFWIDFEPAGGVAEGLSFTLDYQDEKPPQ